VKVKVAAWREKQSYAVFPKQDRLNNPNRAGAQTMQLQGNALASIRLFQI